MEALNKNMEVSKLFKEVMLLLKHNMSKVFEDCGITAPQGMVIGTLSKFGKMKISELSTNLGLSNSTVSGILDRLEKQEMIERERSEEDKRVVYVSVTQKFAEMHQDFQKKLDDNMGNIMNRAVPEDIQKIIEGFNVLKKLLQDNLH
jgi:MarR family transcriptional regulator, organic hydroperoxide resistance regulator